MSVADKRREKYGIKSTTSTVKSNKTQKAQTTQNTQKAQETKTTSAADKRRAKYGIDNTQTTIYQATKPKTTEQKTTQVGDNILDLYPGLSANGGYKKSKLEPYVETEPLRQATLKDVTVNAFKQGMLQSQYGKESYYNMLGKDDTKKNELEEKLRDDSFQYETKNRLQEAIQGASQLAGQIAYQASDPRTVAMMGSAATMARLAGKAGPQALVPEEILTVPMATAAAYKIGSSQSNFEIEAGLAYNELIDNGIDPKLAKAVATGVGGVNAGLEAFQLDELLKSFKVLKRSGNETVANFIADAIKNRAMGVASETTQEVLQEGSTILGNQVASKIQNDEWAYDKEEVLNRLGDTAIQSALSFAALGIAGDTATTLTNKGVDVHETNKTIKTDLKDRGASKEESNDVGIIVKKITQGKTITEKEAEKVSNSTYAIDLLNETTNGMLDTETDLKTKIMDLPKYFKTSVQQDEDYKYKAINTFAKSIKDADARKAFVESYNVDQNPVDYIEEWKSWEKAGRSTVTNDEYIKPTMSKVLSDEQISKAFSSGIKEANNELRLQGDESWINSPSARRVSRDLAKEARLIDERRSGTTAKDYQAAKIQVKGEINPDLLGENLFTFAKEVDGDIESINNVKSLAKADGFEVHFYSGGDVYRVTNDGKIDGNRGIVSTKNGKTTILVRVDDPNFTAEQIYLHESTHPKLWENGKETEYRKELKNTISSVFDKKYDALHNEYTNLLGFADTDSKVFEKEEGMTLYDYVEDEMLCDMKANMNIFEGTTYSYRKNAYSSMYETSKKIADTVTYENKAPPTNQKDKFSKRVENILKNHGVEVTESGTITRYSSTSWKESDKNAIFNALMDARFDKDGNENWSKDDVKKWIANVNSVSAMIMKDPARLDYEADRSQSYIRPNSEYFFTADGSTLCKKRLTYQGTINRIMHEFMDALQPVDLIQIRNMMDEKGYEVPCGFCYEESRKKWEIEFARRWLEGGLFDKTVKGENGKNKTIKVWVDGYKGEYIPKIDEVTTTDGRAKLRREHPQVLEDYLQYQRERGSANPKVSFTKTDYRGEIMQLTEADIEKVKHIGGFRLQSFSDLEIPQIIDLMQVILDMSSRKLTAQAYTKVPEFAQILGNTGVKINLSLVGRLVNGKLVFDDKEGMPHEIAFKIRKKYTKNVGTILVGANDESILAAWADDRIDMVIPFHRSGWSVSEMKALGIGDYTDYSDYQTEKIWNGEKWISLKDAKKEELFSKDYWEKNKTGKENAEIYLKLCAEQGRRPVFYNFLVDNGDNTWSLQPDGSTDGYWKSLVDYKMYDNEGNDSPQTEVIPNFNMREVRKALNEFNGVTNELPVANDVVEEFIERTKDSDGNKLTDGQRVFFTESKVRNEKGNLQIVYHGTDKDFTVFNRKKGRANMDIQGMFFTPYKEDAEGYGKNVQAYFININNPADEKTAYEALNKFKGQNNAGVKAREYLIEQGYDGVYNGYDEYIAFEPNQIKLVSNENPTTKQDIRYSKSVDPTSINPVFISKMEEEISKFKGEKIGASSVISYLKGKGVKDEEIKWTGLEAFLDGKKSVSKEELLQYCKDNALELKETTLKVTNRKNNTHWGEYKLDGGSNYREYLYQLPKSDFQNNAMQTHWGNKYKGVVVHSRVQDFDVNGNKVLFVEEIQSDWHNEGSLWGYINPKDYNKKQQKFAKKEKAASDLIKFVDEYVIDENDTDVFLNQVNSYFDKIFDPDEISGNTSVSYERFAGDGDYGYVLWDDGNPDFYDDFIIFVDAVRSFAYDLKHYFRNPRDYNYIQTDTRVPDAPYGNSKYTDYALKRLLRKAVENGYDYLSWTTGKMQEERWSETYAEGYRIEYDQDIPKFLSKYGKQWNAKLTTLPIGNQKFRFNDGTIADGVEDLLYTAKLGDGFKHNEYTYVEAQDTLTPSVYIYGDGEYLERVSIVSDNNTVQAIPITEEMKQGVMQGQYRYSKSVDSDGNKLSQRQEDFFKDSKVRDDNGNLLVLYHGTTSDFTVFDAREGNSSFGKYKFGNRNVVYLTSSNANAESFSDYDWTNRRHRVFKLYANINNPYIIDAKKESSFKIKDDKLRNYQVKLFNDFVKLAKGNYYDGEDIDYVNEMLSPFRAEIRKYDEYDYELFSLPSNALFTAENYLGSGYSISDIFNEYEEDIREYLIGDDDDYYMTTDDVVNLVLSQYENYDGVIIKNVFESASMFGEYATDVIAFNSNQVKQTTNLNPTSDNDIRYSKSPDAIYTEQQYNNYGWARANDILSKYENEILKKKALTEDRAKLSNNEYAIIVGKSDGIGNKVVITNNSKTNPKILRVVAIDIDGADFDVESYLPEIRRYIYDQEQDRDRLWTSYEVLNLYAEAEILRSYSKEDCPSYIEYRKSRQYNKETFSDGGKDERKRVYKFSKTITEGQKQLKEMFPDKDMSEAEQYMFPDGMAVYRSEINQRDTKTVKLQDARIDRLLNEYGSDIDKDYAKAYIGQIKINDFLNLTLEYATRVKWDKTSYDEAYKEVYPLDVKKLSENTQTPFLIIEGRDVIGHEGRHRARALLEAGYEKMPIAIIEYDTKYTKNPEDNKILFSQDFGRGRVNDSWLAFVNYLIPLNPQYEPAIKEMYGKGEGLRYSKVPTYTELAKENDLLKNKVKILNEVTQDNIRLRRELTRNASAEVVNVPKTVAKDILNIYHSTIKYDELKKDFTDLANYILRGDDGNVSYDKIKELSNPIAYKIVSSASELVNAEDFVRYKDAKKYFNSYTMRNIDSLWDTEIANQFGWPDSSETFEYLGDTYNLSTTEDKKRLVEDYINAMAPVYENPFSYEISEAVESCSNAIADSVLTGLLSNKIKQMPKSTVDRYEDKISKLLFKEKERREKEVNRLKEKGNKKELRRKIYNTTKRMSSMLLNPTDKRHIPEELQNTVATLLNAINLESGFSIDENGKRDYSKNTEPTKKTKAFDNLRKQYAKMIDDLEINNDVAVEITQKIDSITEYSDTPIDRMNISQLNEVYEVLSMVDATVRNANKMFFKGRYQTVSDFAEAVYKENANKKFVTKDLGAIQTHLTLNMMRPNTYFGMLGKQGFEMWSDLREAQDKFITITKETSDYSNKLKEGYGIGKLDDKVTVKLGGSDVEVERGQLLDLYNLFMRGLQAQEHIMFGGITIKNKGENKRTIRNIKVEELGNAFAQLTANEIAYADDLRNYLGVDLAKYGNETSMTLFGYEKFKEGKNYWPIRTDENNKAPEKQGEVKSTTNKGFTKATTPHAKNAIRIENVDDVFANHTYEMAMYSSYSQATEDLRKLWNYKSKSEDCATIWTMQELTNNVFGVGGHNYWGKLLRDIASGIENENTLTTAFLGNWKAAAVGANLRVIIQQPTAILRALSMIDAKYLFNTKSVNEGWEKAKKYAPIAQWKDWGYFDINTGKKMKDILFNDPTKLEKTKQILLKPAGWADSLAWGQLWNACELEVKDKQPGLTGEKFYQTVAKRFSDIVDNTQVVDGILQRSQIMRDGGGLNKMATSFLGEPTMMYNMAMKAAYDVKQNPSAENKNKFARTALGLVIAGTINAFVQSIIDGLRDDDKDEKYWEKVLYAFIGDYKDAETFGQKAKAFFSSNIIENFNPATMIPYIKDAYSIIMGYTVKRNDMEPVYDTVQAMNYFIKSLNGTGKFTWQQGLINLIAETSRLFGVPVANIKRDVYSIISTTINAIGNYRLMYEYDKFMYNTNNSSNKSKFYDSLYQAKYNDKESYNYIYKDMIKLGFEEKDIKKALNNREKLNPTKEESKSYEKAEKRLTSNPIYKKASETKQKSARDDLYALQVGVDSKTVDNIRAKANKEIGFTEEEYLLYRLALDVVDEPNKNGELGGTPTKAEVEAAIELLNLSQKEKTWIKNGFKEK